MRSNPAITSTEPSAATTRLGHRLNSLVLPRGVAFEQERELRELRRAPRVVIVEPQQVREDAFDLCMLSQELGVHRLRDAGREPGVEPVLLDGEVRGHVVGELGDDLASPGHTRARSLDELVQVSVLCCQELERVDGGLHGEASNAAHVPFDVS
jgi:hypothetical protein